MEKYGKKIGKNGGKWKIMGKNGKKSNSNWDIFGDF